MKKHTVVTREELNEIYGYQIFFGKRLPLRDKFIGICIGFECTIEESQKILKSAGFGEIYPKKSKRKHCSFRNKK